MRRRTSNLLYSLTSVGLALGALSACDTQTSGSAGSGDGSSVVDETDVSELECASSPELTMINAGAEPRTALALTPTIGDQVALELAMDMSISIEVDGSSAPTGTGSGMTMGMVAQIDSVSDGQITMSFEYDEADGGADSTVDSVLQSLVGTTGTITTDTRGVYIEGSVDFPSGVDPTLASTLDQLEQQLANMTTPLPEDAVGLGAKWDVQSPIEINGIKACNTYTYTLDQLDGTTYSLSVEIAQEMATGPFEYNGVHATLNNGSSTGSGTMSGDLTMPLSTAGTTDVESTSSISAKQGSNTQDIETDIDVSTTISTRE